MNKFVKGSIAAGAATVLLLGGAGSLAYWNDNADLADIGTVNAGELTLSELEDAGEWTAELTNWVPGDAATYTTVLTLTAEGDNIRGEITLDEDSLVVTPAAAAGQFDVTFNAGTLPTELTYDADAEKITFTDEGVYTVPVEVKVEFAYDTAAAQNASQNAEIDLTDLAFVVTQTVATGAVTTP